MVEMHGTQNAAEHANPFQVSRDPGLLSRHLYGGLGRSEWGGKPNVRTGTYAGEELLVAMVVRPAAAFVDQISIAHIENPRC
jgi:hypothetical protein